MKITRRKVIALAFLAGLVTGAAVPSHAATYGAGISHETATVSDVEDCTVTTTDGEQYALSDCDDQQFFSEGDFITVEHDRDQNITSLISSDGDEVLTDN